MNDLPRPARPAAARPAAARSAAALLALCALAGASAAHAAPPDGPSQPIPDPGKAVASGDDSSAIAVNPANLAFLPGSELRWTWVSTGSASPLPARGHSLAFALPLWLVSTGLRVDFLDPPAAAPAPLDSAARWIRWGLALETGPTFAFGTTLGWGSSDAPALDDHFSLTSGITLRPYPWLSLAAVARDWNRPESRLREAIERSYDLGIAVRPLGGRRALELGLETSYTEGDAAAEAGAWVPRATLALEVPYVGTLRGDVSLRDLRASGGPRIAAMAGLDINLDETQLSAGGVFGDALTKSGAGFYAGAALRGFREPGVRMPARVVKIRLDSTPGVRRHTRFLQQLWRLADDPEVSGVALVLRAEPASSLAHAEEVGDAIRNLRRRGKKVLCHLEDAGGRSLHVCSQADAIAMNPAGGLRFSGISSSYFYFGGLLKKLGVQADFVRIGAHKLAAEQFVREGSTQIGKEDHQELIDQLSAGFLAAVSAGRRIPVDELKRRLARGPFLAQEAKQNQLVDHLAFDDELGRVVDEVMGRPSRLGEDDPGVSAPERWGRAPKIALVYLDGDMIDGESQSIPLLGVKLAGSYTIANALRRAREDGSVRAVVLRVQTGGGSSLAADVILREAILTARVKPLIVSMGSQAASGGYYAAVAGSPIFANRSTVTGSIGIFYGKVDVAGLLAKLGVQVETFRTAPRADAESLYRPFTDDERAELGVVVKRLYDRFVGRVAEGRRMRPEDVDAIARGRVWTGAQAVERRLVDRIGGLRDAIAEARRLGQLSDDAPILSLPEEDTSLLGMVLGLAGVSAGQQGELARATIPPVLLDAARALTPFLVFGADKPLARSELAGEISFGAPFSTREDEPAGPAPEEP
ncbi:protease IV [Sorangium cellulosum]|uniref:Protease IV n=1 Tax=Sorangium cellulosum TaxID=56 RepID=A0A2L0F9D8_SORCE|nr:signal peptide peptidase SppA [Sorangium cellulosum]AUX48102.1 protease IV [Sorangium cellulosum]